MFSIGSLMNQVDYELVGYIKPRKGCANFEFIPIEHATKYDWVLDQVGIRRDLLSSDNVVESSPGASDAFSMGRKLKSSFANTKLFTCRRGSDNKELTVTSKDMESKKRFKKVLEFMACTPVYLCVWWNQVADNHIWFDTINCQPEIRYDKKRKIFEVEVYSYLDFKCATYNEIKGK